MRFRTLFTIGGSIIALAALFVTDVDKGAGAAMVLLKLAMGIVAVTFAFFSTKGLFDYKSADKESLFAIAAKDPVGAGLALVAWAIVFNGLLGLFSGTLH